RVLRLQVRSQHAERLAIQVVDDRGQEEQRSDPPAVARGAHHATGPTATPGSTRSTSARRSNPVSALRAFAVPHATPRRSASSNGSFRWSPVPSPPSRQSPEPTEFTTCTGGAVA